MKTILSVILFLLLGHASRVTAETETYDNPVDGKSYSADWKTYEPSGRAIADSKGRVVLQSVRLLSEQSAFDENIPVKALSEFIKSTQATIESTTSNFTAGCELIIQTTLSPNEQPKFEMSSKGEVSQQYLQAVYDALGKLPDRRSKNDVLKYQIHFVVKEKGPKQTAQ